MPVDWIGALLTGMVVGIIFSAASFPIPAPPKLAGIMGIVGIYLGYQLVQHWDRILAVIP